MPEFLRLLSPDEARKILFRNLPDIQPLTEKINTNKALGRVVAEDIFAPHPLPEFKRATMDGFAVHANDTYGASDAQPAYLELIGEILMGTAPDFEIQVGTCAIIHTGGMLPKGADAVVMMEYTQIADKDIEIFRSVAEGENILQIGEDVKKGQIILPRGIKIRPAEIGGLMALGITELRVVNKPRIGIIPTGNEVISPKENPIPGQIRDINSFSLSALVAQVGGKPIQYDIVPDDFDMIKEIANKALSTCEAVVIIAGSSASTRDMTVQVISKLGKPGVLVHGINIRPGKPTILGACNKKAVIGLPGNPVSALIIAKLFLVPVIEKMLFSGQAGDNHTRPSQFLIAKVTTNVQSQAGREDWVEVKLKSVHKIDKEKKVEWLAEPIFGKSNLIFSLVAADGLIRIPPDVTGLGAGEVVEVMLLD